MVVSRLAVASQPASPLARPPTARTAVQPLPLANNEPYWPKLATDLCLKVVRLTIIVLASSVAVAPVVALLLLPNRTPPHRIDGDLTVAVT